MSLADRATFKLLVPRAARNARRVLVVSERTKRDLIELYDLPEERIVVTPNGVDPIFTRGDGAPGSYLLFVGAIQARKDPRAALEAAKEAGLPLIVAGPERDPDLARELAAGGADLRGYVPTGELVELYRGAAALVFPSRYEGFGLPALEAMACGTPVVATPDPGLREVAGDAALYANRGRLGETVRRAVAERERLVAAGLERARGFTWAETARRTLEVYREAMG
jgi:glycosyltransferase involved in cell wall biosynthesis